MNEDVQLVDSRENITIKSLFSGYSGNYKPTEIDWGEAVGNEVC